MARGVGEGVGKRGRRDVRTKGGERSCGEREARWHMGREVQQGQARC